MRRELIRLQVKRMSYDGEQNYFMVVGLDNESHVIPTNKLVDVKPCPESLTLYFYN